MKLANKLALTAAVIALTALSLTAQAKDSTELFAGGDIANQSFYTYVGGVTAFNQNLDTNGWLARVFGGYGGYNYSRGNLPSVDGKSLDGSLSLGYQYYLMPGTRVSAFLGGNVENDHLSPDNRNNRVHGTKEGGVGQLELASDLGSRFSMNALGSYSTAFDTYWSKVNVGYNFGPVTIGPEALFLGSQSFDQQRYGAFLGNIALVHAVKLGFEGGYEKSSRDDSRSGGYGDVSLSTRF